MDRRIKAPILALCVAAVAMICHTPPPGSRLDRPSNQRRARCSFGELRPKLYAARERIASGLPLFPGAPTLRDRPLREAVRGGENNQTDLPILDWRREPDRRLAAALVEEMIPFVIHQSEAARRIVDLWTRQYILDNYADRVVISRAYDEMVRFTRTVDETRLKLRDTLATSDDRRQYIKCLNHTHGERLAASALFDHPKLLPEGYSATGCPTCNISQYLRFGFSRVEVGLHYDSEPAFLVQMENAKKFVLMHPLYDEEVPYIRDLSNPEYTEAANPSPRSHPDAFGGARGLSHVLRPGEVLYLPPLWWHHVETLNDGFWSSLSGRFLYEGYNADTTSVRAPFPRNFGHRGDIYPCGRQVWD